MSMGRWVFSIYSNFQCGIFRWSMRSSSMSPWRGGWTSEPCWWRGRSLSSIYLSINLRQQWETFKLKTTFKTNLWTRWSRRRLWWRKLNGSRWVFIWMKENRNNARKTICQENFQDFAKKYRLLEFWLRREWKNFLGREIMVSDWRNICLVQFWSFLGGTSPISVPDATWPFWGILTEFTFGNKKFNIWYHLAIVLQIDQDLVF